MRSLQQIVIPAWVEGLLIGSCLSLLWIPWAMTAPVEGNPQSISLDSVESSLLAPSHAIYQLNP